MKLSDNPIEIVGIVLLLVVCMGLFVATQYMTKEQLDEIIMMQQWWMP